MFMGNHGHVWLSEDNHLSVWLVVSTPLKNMKVNKDDYSQYMEKWKMIQTIHQITTCLWCLHEDFWHCVGKSFWTLNLPVRVLGILWFSYNVPFPIHCSKLVLLEIWVNVSITIINHPFGNSLSKEVWKLNFRQYGEMKMQCSPGEAQKWRKSEERRCRRAKR